MRGATGKRRSSGQSRRSDRHAKCCLTLGHSRVEGCQDCSGALRDGNVDRVWSTQIQIEAADELRCRGDVSGDGLHPLRRARHPDIKRRKRVRASDIVSARVRTRRAATAENSAAT